MPWPSLGDYTQAVRDFPHISILDPELQGGTPRRGANNNLIVYSGGFSGVFPIEVLSNTYALRCWTRDIGDAETRYEEISDYLKQYRLPYFVDFAYVPEGILVNGIKYPVTRMEWAEGNTLCDFIEHNLQDARCLKTAAVEFQKMVAALHAHQISHGDLQDGNILLKRSGTDVEIKLIDYDSVFVPALRGQPDTIVGVPAYQHPQRIASGGSENEKVDYFSELVIYLSLLSLAEKPDLWSQFGAPTEKRLLFIAEDFKNPDQSDVFRELANLSPDVKQLASKLKEFCKRSVDQLEPLEAVLPSSSPAQVIYDQGLVYLHSNRYSEAIVEFEKAIGLDANYKEAYHGLGLAHLKMGNLGEAKRKAERALGIDPHYQPAHQLLDTIKSFKPPPPPPPPPGPPRPTSLKSAFNLWQYIAPNLWQYITSALAFILLICIVALATQMGAKNEALHSIQMLSNEKAQLLRENQKLQNQLTEQNRETRTQRFIVQQLQSQLIVQSKETETQRTIVRQLRTQIEKLQSENVILREQLNGQVPPPLPPRQLRVAPLQKIYRNISPEVKSDAMSKNNQGYFDFNKGKYDDAIKHFENAIKSDSQSAIVHYNLGSTYLVMKKYPQAAKSLRRVIDLDPNFKEAHYNLALTQFRRGYHQASINMARSALSIDRNYQLARQLLEAIE